MARIGETEVAILTDILRTVARAEILPRFQRLDAAQIATKSGPLDLVTEADTAAEAAIRAAIAARWPEALVVGEEAVAADPALRHRIHEAELAFMIDPVDGTWNFAHGLPLFGIILGVARRGVPVAGLLYDPVTDTLIAAAEGGPAHRLHGDGRREALTLAAPQPLADLTGYMHLFLMPKPEQAALAPVLPRFSRVYALRCSCHEYRTLAQGSVQFCLSGTLNPWDHLAGVAIVQAAGGHAGMLDGRPYSTSVTHGHLLVAASRASWDLIAAELAPVLPPVPAG